MKGRLTVRSVEAIEPGERDVICWDRELSGFGLKVTPRGKRSFFLYYRTTDHVQRRPLIGTYPAMRPEKARGIAQDWLAEVRAGGDPSSTRRAKRAARGEGTVAELFEDYKKANDALRSLPEIGRIFQKDILPTLGKRRAEDVTRSEVSRLLDKLSNRSPTAASNARKRLSAFYTWALPRLPDGAVNPVHGAVAAPAPAARERVLSDFELQALWMVLEGEAEPWRSALRLLILTGQRRGEVFAANWSEFDLETGMWTIPAARTKNGKVHMVPLSAPCLELLQAAPQTGPVMLTSAQARVIAALTGRDLSEVRGARWREFDLDAAVWKLPRSQLTTGRAVNVPLPADAIELLAASGRSGPLFPGGARAFSRAARNIRKALDRALSSPALPWSWHDLRRTVATGLQRLGVRLEVTEAVLNHVSGSRAGIVGVYQRYDWLEEKRAALEHWGRHVIEAPARVMQ